MSTLITSKNLTQTHQKNQKGALVIFAKTPGLSPVKTRLAADIGTKKAIEYYESFLKIIEKKALEIHARTNHNIIPYWEVAEAEAINLPRWQKLNVVHSGEGGLGERLHYIYNGFLYEQQHKKNDYVIIIGSDTPQIPIELILDIPNKLNHQSKIIIGPATDGGFYLFAGNHKIAKHTWTNVTYSQDTTLNQLIKNLPPTTNIETLIPLTDIDTSLNLDHVREGNWGVEL